MADLELDTQRLARLARRLSDRGECRLWLMYRYQLAVEPALLRQPLQLRIDVAGAAEMEDVAALHYPREPERVDARARLYRDRIEAGSLCFVARDADGEIVACNWIRIGSAIGAHGVRMHLADDEIYTTDAYTAPAWRGHGLHPALNRAMLVHARRLGFRVACTLVRADNERSAVALPRVGWQHVGSLLHWQPAGPQRAPVWRTCGAIEPMRTVEPERVEPHAGAVALAERLEPYARRELVGVRPWSNLYRLGGDVGTAYLKIVAPVQAPAMRLSRLLAEDLAKAVAPVIACSAADPAWLLMRDHAAQPVDPTRPPERALARLLETVAAIQAHAAQRPQLLAAAPLLDVASTWAWLAEQLGDGRALAGLVGIEAARAARALLHGQRERLQRYSAAAETLPLTLEHTKLGLDNAAFLPDGTCLVTSWNDALVAPAGLSLHRLFGGVVRTLELFPAAIGKAASAPVDGVEVDALRVYLDALVRAGYADGALLHRALPGAIALGPAARLLALAQIDNDDPDQRAVLAAQCTGLLAQVLAWLAQPEPDGTS